MSEELRSCRRTGCRWPAAASLSYRYASSQVWLLDLSEAAHPSLYDLCPHHADHLTVPRGWELVDQRTSPPAVIEPAARDRVPEQIPDHLREPAEVAARSGSTGSAVQRGGGSRYAVLAEDLPRLAASLADHPDLQDDSRPAADGGSPGARPAGPDDSADVDDHADAVEDGHAQPPSRNGDDEEVEAQTGSRTGNRDHQVDTEPEPEPSKPEAGGPAVRPVPAHDATAATGAESGADIPRPEVKASEIPPELRQVEGQLTMPLEDVQPRGDEHGAVVVSIDRAGGRRREGRGSDLKT